MEIFPKDSLAAPGGRARWGERRRDEEMGKKALIEDEKEVR